MAAPELKPKTPKPKDPKVPERTDDTSGVEIDVVALRKKYIDPIESIRSLKAISPRTKPTKKDNGKLVLLDLSPITDSPKESRAHAFLRACGFPIVAAGTKSFISPGFKPKTVSTPKELTAEDVFFTGNGFTEDQKNSQYEREKNARNRYKIFQAQDDYATMYSICVALTPKFNILGKDPVKEEVFGNIKQEVSVTKRSEYIKAKYQTTSGSINSVPMANVAHNLKPFTVDPVIANSLEDDKKIAAPFLMGKNDVYLENNKSVPRPLIEEILRKRLNQRVSTLASNIIDIVIATKDAPKTADIYTVAEILSNKDKATADDLIKAIGPTTSELELKTIEEFVKTLKGLVSVFVKSRSSIGEVVDKVTWNPLCAKGGPEKGTKITDGTLVPDESIRRALNKDLLVLKVKNAIAKAAATEASASDKFYQPPPGEFVTPDGSTSVAKTYDDEIKKIEKQIAGYQQTASNALMAIELIRGEISGLGLIDIIAMYITFWSVPVDVLLSLLDDSAFQRMSQDPALNSSEVVDSDQGAGLYTIEDAIFQIEKQFFTILSYVDNLIEKSKGKTQPSTGGTVSKG